MNLIGFDFSCNKPGCCVKLNEKIHFALWPLELDNKSIEKFKMANVYIDNRQRLTLGKNSSEKFRWHVSMANDLSNKIISYIKETINSNEETIIAFEGSSFGSKGDAGLQLAGYRYILMNELGKIYGLHNIFTYAPLTIKSIAGCASKDKKGKDSIIEAFKELNVDHDFCKVLRNNPELLRKKTNYIMGVDDLTDAFFTLETLRKKEGI